VHIPAVNSEYKDVLILKNKNFFI